MYEASLAVPATRVHEVNLLTIAATFYTRSSVVSRRDIVLQVRLNPMTEASDISENDVTATTCTIAVKVILTTASMVPLRALYLLSIDDFFGAAFDAALTK